MLFQFVRRRRSVARIKRLERLRKASKQRIGRYMRSRLRKAQTAFQQLFLECCKPKTVSRSVWISQRVLFGGMTSLRRVSLMMRG